ncbi:MAG: PadR family transcriptional regulator [Candidatus Parvarchaeota archaeon]|nr:PadR family transcriptional regulator [Candidatus Jingweiarchaeum tengchongense]MCW1298116.1 PadR family transcriptional regulator [Candidatus Jingweiarchaeum tengchongense]MCW1299915.1 PadR family transcriptional regulator [Candidatus Jingweiarchaeum tengchongense]MCW1305132.1 PadR family transcriptional regulator [Candidatus Jingweiarchaeum tengchongense]MCW1305537.1 PadR family transcriptional regulator [Candidatus Jingweiarchaeum tengchongense]
MKKKFDVIPGMLCIFVLKLLSKKKMHGYEIINEIKEKTHHCWKPSAGTIYPLLRRMEEKKLIRRYGKDKRKISYAITKKGKMLIKRIDRIRESWMKNFYKFNEVFRHVFKTPNAEIDMILLEIRNKIKSMNKEKITRAEKILIETKRKLEELESES